MVNFISCRLSAISCQLRIEKKHNLFAKAQSTLEIALSLICVFILLFGSLNVFLWMNKKIIHRQEDYEATRQVAGDTVPGMKINETYETRYPDLDIFEKVK